MNRLALLTFISVFAAGCNSGSMSESDHEHGDDHGHGHDDGHANEHAEEEFERGSHNGRMLRQGDIAVELAIYETGIPPEFRAWLYRDGQPLPPSSGSLQVTVDRLGGASEEHAFAVRGDFLVGDLEVYEPHSFTVRVTAEVDGTPARWEYDSLEGRTSIAPDIAEQSGIRVAAVGPGVIRDEHEVQGLITPIEGQHAHLSARFPGPIRSVRVGVGDAVSKGQTLATIESNVSMAPYALRAPIDGVVLERRASVGEMAADQVLFEIADLSSLWIDLHLFGRDAQHITPGLPVVVSRLSDGVSAQLQLDRVLPATATASQSTVARAVLQNEDGQWRPGAAVRARVTVAEDPVELIVPLAALQRFRDWQVVFIRVGDEYEIRPLELGRRDAVHVEVMSGLNLGDQVVVEQSYLIKADIEKSGASHDH